MFKTVVLVAALAFAAHGLPPIRDASDIRNLQIAEPLKDLRETNEIDKITGENDQSDYLEPDWAAQGSLESEEDVERSERSASFDSDEDFFGSDTPDCDFDSSEESSEERIPESHVKSTETAKIDAESTTVDDAKPEATTEQPVDIPAIDRRFGVPEVRQKRMAWRVMHSSNEFDDDNPPKVRWMWDDQKPEVPPAVAKEVDEPDGFGPRVDHVEVDVQKPCASRFYRRDRHGRCRLTLV